METMKIIKIVALILTAIGAINWGLTVMGTNLVTDVLPKGLHKIIFGLVGLSGLLVLYFEISKMFVKKEVLPVEKEEKQI